VAHLICTSPGSTPKANLEFRKIDTLDDLVQAIIQFKGSGTKPKLLSCKDSKSVRPRHRSIVAVGTYEDEFVLLVD
jgi:hypothetical protein